MNLREKILKAVGDSKMSDLAWKYCDLNDEENGDYVEELTDKILSLIRESLQTVSHHIIEEEMWRLK